MQELQSTCLVSAVASYAEAVGRGLRKWKKTFLERSQSCANIDGQSCDWSACLAGRLQYARGFWAPSKTKCSARDCLQGEAVIQQFADMTREGRQWTLVILAQAQQLRLCS